MEKKHHNSQIKVVVSAPNCTAGGILMITKELLSELNNFPELDITAIVNSKDLFSDIKNLNINYVELPESKKSWFKRLWYEYYKFKYLAKDLKTDIWLSMHDITPSVDVPLLATYCHNPCPFYSFKFKDFKYDKKFGLFVLLYKYLYKINIKKNDLVFVQQEWLKQSFENMFSLNNVVVTRPEVNYETALESTTNKREKTISFFYPSFPRVFKNFEVICRAVEELTHTFRYNDFEVTLTIDGSENEYSRDLVKRFKYLKNIKFIGLQPQMEVFRYYNQSDILIFPSKLETWGLPLSEFKGSLKPIIASDLPYAKETIECYNKVNFFDPDNYVQLAEIMKSHIDGTPVYSNNSLKHQNTSLRNWQEFITFVKEKYNKKTNA